MRTLTRVLAFVGPIALSDSFPAARAADRVPEFNITANCKDADSPGTGVTLNKCADDEQRAKRQLAEQWSNFAQDDKAQCIKETNIAGTPSYVELQICLQMASDENKRATEGLGRGSKSGTKGRQ
jgi:LAS superfamily LD-carboxypeptidase LdcB